MEEVRQVAGKDQVDEGQEHLRPLLRHRGGDEGEDAEGRIPHDDRGQLVHRLARGLDRPHDRLPLVARQGGSDAEEHGKGDDRQDVTLGQRVEGVGRDKIPQDLFQGGHRGCFEPRDRCQLHPGRRIQDQGYDQADGDGDGRRGQVEDHDLHAHTAELDGIADGRRAGHQREEHQGDDEHLEESEEEVAHPAQRDAGVFKEDAEGYPRPQSR